MRATVPPIGNGDPLVQPADAGRTRGGARRLDSIDRLRGLMIALMVLDHVRDFFGTSSLHDPTDPDRSWPLLYATRWITHLCAPTFVLLAGVSIFLQARAGKTPAALSRFLLSRGAWLIVLELTVVSFGFNFGEPFVFLQVIYAIGLSMIGMSLVARLPAPLVLALGVALVATCPWAAAASLGAVGLAGVSRTLLLAPGFLPGVPSLAMYPALPWFGIMCLGFGLAPLFVRPDPARTRSLGALALVLLVTFVLLRTGNGFGDPSPWAERAEPVRSVMSYLNVSKYPPSPDYVLVTLGVALLVFLVLDRLRGPVARVLLDFGRTPLFTYILHIYVAHAAMLMLAVASGQAGAALDVIAAQTSDAIQPLAWGYSLAGVYVAWLSVVAVLILPARWWAGVKRRRRDWWLSYL